MLSGKKIQSEVEAGRILIEPFNPEQLNPNSYDVRLGARLLVYDSVALDMRFKAPVEELIIPKEGLQLVPRRLYLAETIEQTWSDTYAPQLAGRSSVGRLGLFVHVSAGFGDVGWRGKWTLELYPTMPIRVYPGVKIGQVFWSEVDGDLTQYASDKYQNANGAQASRLYMDFDKYHN